MKDLIVIGGGPGGYVAAIRAAQLGMQVTLVEKDELGGTCLNRGCIPTKSYYENAAVLRMLRHLDELNVQGDGGYHFDLPGAYQRKQSVVGGLVQGIGNLLAANGVEVVKGFGQIESAGQVTVGERLFTAKRILIASGSITARPAIPGMDLPGVLTSDELLELQAVPKRLTVIGGGVIGLEFACIFQAFGSDVTVIEYLPDLLGSTDKEIAKRMRAYLKRQGINLLTGTAVESIRLSADGLHLLTDNKGKPETVADVIFVATGRKPNSAALGLDRLGIATDRRGCIVVDDDYQTSVPGIYAIGDVIGGMMLAHVASEEGRVAVERMSGLESQVPCHAVPAVVFSSPEIATVGLSEEDVRDKGIPYRIGKALFTANSKAVVMGETDGLIKVVADHAGTIVGVHIIGPHASDLIQAATIIVKERLTVEDVASTIHPHPTLSETLLEAVLDVEKRAIHLLPRH